MISLNINSNIRRIDELGRIVIPKDIRKKLFIKDNEPLEIYIENDEIKIKKYSILDDKNAFMNDIVSICNRITNNQYIITDREKVICSTNNDFQNDNISDELKNIVVNAEEKENEKIELEISNNKIITGYISILSILVDGDRLGVVIEYNINSQIKDETAIKIIKNLIEKKYSNC